MRKLALCALFGCVWPLASNAAETPLPADLHEQVEVDLVILDAVVLDRGGRPIEGLTIDEFQVVVDGEAVAVDTLDFNCSESRAGRDGVREALDRPRQKHKFVFALDYSHLDSLQRGHVIDEVQRMIRREATDSMELMVAAMTGEMRIEQALTPDRETVLASLDRMKRDPELWKPSFYHQNERGFIESLNSLFDVLGRKEGTKIVLFFSAIEDVPLERQFARVAAAAAASRSVIYGVDVRGLLTDGGVADGFSRVNEEESLGQDERIETAREVRDNTSKTPGIAPG